MIGSRISLTPQCLNIYYPSWASKASHTQGCSIEFCVIYILLHDWEGNTGRYSIRDRPYRPNQREGRYRGREQNISQYCLIQGIAIIDLLYDFPCHYRQWAITSVSIGTGNNERAIRGNMGVDTMNIITDVSLTPQASIFG